MDQIAELQAVVNSRDVSAAVASRARVVLWATEGRPKKDVAALAGLSRPTVDLWLSRYREHGLAGLLERPRGAPREQVPARVRARILALTGTTPPAETGLSHWSSREMARYVERTEGVSVSWHYVAKLWRDNDLKPHRQGTFTSVNALIRRIRDYVEHWNSDAAPFVWTATADDILAKVRWVETNVKQLVANNSK